MKTLVVAVILPLLVGCSSLASSGNDPLHITSEPPGAAVYIFDELAGTTPLQVATARVFPHTYPQEKKEKYGRVLLRKEGCVDHQVTVSTRAVSDGLHARLSCGPTTPEQNVSDVRVRLKRLEEFRKDGTISEEEYAAHRSRILGEL